MVGSGLGSDYRAPCRQVSSADAQLVGLSGSFSNLARFLGLHLPRTALLLDADDDSYVFCFLSRAPTNSFMIVKETSDG